MADCLHMFRGYRVPQETVEAVRRAIIETPRRVDVRALREAVEPALVPVNPWPSTTRSEAARCAVSAFLFDAVRAGLVKRRVNAWQLPAWWRVRKPTGAVCR
ncbi:MAG: hypothetical protein ACN6PJ_23050 [Achromobacter sp.]|jgi:hypothetical protein|uniref:hypothetical protein n=1 Tax=Achromobacter TaxID=222 RepID=UPI002432485B|nr:hypothetical protein [Achromobacter denitrificans]MBV2161398.1 hypothetical protein [Achromobacter denitrificans]